MPREESVLPKPLQSNSWNVVRSRSIPSGVSGSHAIARPVRPVATDTSFLASEETVPQPIRKSLKDLRLLDHVGLKH